MDGAWFFSPGVTMVNVLPPAGTGGLPMPPCQTPAPTFSPPSGTTTPTNVTISCSSTGAVIYFTLDGSLPSQGSPGSQYTNSLSITSAVVVRAVAYTTGCLPSIASVAFYQPPTLPPGITVNRTVSTNPFAPVVTFNVLPGTNATCVTLTESLPFGLSASNVTAGGSYDGEGACKQNRYYSGFHELPSSDYELPAESDCPRWSERSI
ncbi:MAG: hypothetical protein C5B50_14310 [Verrucomicrobia bacterium]|nr:MAG: hypothetical protein C5B50_14310 [Verrucomicrobiota bacterium]